ncbi:MAG: type II secretion system F family protein [Armatimonadota bacterium]|nr:type II secretion system F family protein [Armatimonadota bacterium]
MQWDIVAAVVLNIVIWFSALTLPRASTATQRLHSLLARHKTPRRSEATRSVLPRFLLSLLEKPAHHLRENTPREWRQKLSQSLIQAGLEVDPAIFMALRLMGGMGGILVGMMLSAVGVPLPAAMGLALGLGALGVIAPQIWLTRRHRARKRQLRQEIPGAIELVAMCLEAGMTFDAAVKEYTQVEREILGRLLGQYLEDRGWGQTREEAFRFLIMRGGCEELTQVVSAIENGITLGVPLAKVLREQASFLRTLNLRHAEEQAHQLPVKLLFPLVLFMFPALFLIILGPIVIQLVRSGFGN